MRLTNIRFVNGYSKTVYIDDVAPMTPTTDLLDFALEKTQETAAKVFDTKVSRVEDRAVVTLYLS